jgi:hypothetical protein
MAKQKEAIAYDVIMALFSKLNRFEMDDVEILYYLVSYLNREEREEIYNYLLDESHITKSDVNVVIMLINLRKP